MCEISSRLMELVQRRKEANARGGERSSTLSSFFAAFNFGVKNKDFVVKDKDFGVKDKKLPSLPMYNMFREVWRRLERGPRFVPISDKGGGRHRCCRMG